MIIKCMDKYENQMYPRKPKYGKVILNFVIAHKNSQSLHVFHNTYLSKCLSCI